MVMVNRWSLMLLIVGVIAGYVISGTSVNAQTDLLPLAVGETVILRYPPTHATDSSPWVECSVMEIRGVYIRCEAPAARPGIPAVVLWRNLQSVAIVQKDQ
jgi:hypothetical protein